MAEDRVARVRKAKYLEYQINIGENETIEDVKRNLAEIFPEVANATAVEDENGDIIITVQAGTKG